METVPSTQLGETTTLRANYMIEDITPVTLLTSYNQYGY